MSKREEYVKSVVARVYEIVNKESPIRKHDGAMVVTDGFDGEESGYHQYVPNKEFCDICYIDTWDSTEQTPIVRNHVDTYLLPPCDAMFHIDVNYDLEKDARVAADTIVEYENGVFDSLKEKMSDFDETMVIDLADANVDIGCQEDRICAVWRCSYAIIKNL
jgi:hypothetical protein